MTDAARAFGALDPTLALSPSSIGQVEDAHLRASNDPLLGHELLGSYRIARVLSDGGMGRLYAADHLRIDRGFAVKVLHHPLAQREDMRARFEREARAIGRVRSEHIVAIVDVAKAPDGRTCIVTELLSGMDLEQRLTACGGKLAAAEAVHLTRQALRGLCAAHALGIVHRDLKPSNLFLAQDSTGQITVKILDFGVAKLGGDADVTATGVIVGTPAYMAPEQARDSTRADARSDVYASGAVLYRLLTGRSPYAGHDSHGTLVRLMEEAPERPSVLDNTIPAGLEAVIEKAMARDPDERFQSATELDRALSPFDVATGRPEGGAVAVDEACATTELGRRARRARPLAVMWIALAALAVGAVVASALSLVVDAASANPTLTRSESVLIGVVAAIATVAAGVALGRSLASVFRNVAMVQARSTRIAGALLTCVATLGAFQITETVWASFVLARPSAHASLWGALKFLLAFGAGAYALTRVQAKRRSPEQRARR